MLELLLLISLVVLVLAFSLAVGGWWISRCRLTGSAAPPQPPMSEGPGPDGPAEGGDGEAEAETGLAAFYAYQIAAGKIERAP
jgi:hypothetical protein